MSVAGNGTVCHWKIIRPPLQPAAGFGVPPALARGSGSNRAAFAKSNAPWSAFVDPLPESEVMRHVSGIYGRYGIPAAHPAPDTNEDVNSELLGRIAKEFWK